METTEQVKPTYTAPFDTTTFSNMTMRQYNALPSYVEKEFRQGPNAQAFTAKIDALEGSPAQSSARATRTSEPAATPSQDFSGDPSWADSDEDGPPVKAAAQPAAAEVPAAPVEGEELVWEYQPEKNGKPIGGLQRFKYRTKDELIEKLTSAYKAATVELKRRKAEALIEEVKSVATAYQEPKFLDPKEPNAEQINSLTSSAVKNATLSALHLFQLQHPSFQRGESNASVLIQWISRSGRDPGDAQTWTDAFDWAVSKNLLELVPAAAVPAVEQPKPQPAQAAPAAPVRRAIVPPPTGLSSVDGGDDIRSEVIRPAAVVNGAQTFEFDGKRITLSPENIDRVPTSTLSRLMKSKSNCAKLELIYAVQAEQQAARRSR